MFTLLAQLVSILIVCPELSYSSTSNLFL